MTIDDIRGMIDSSQHTSITYDMAIHPDTWQDLIDSVNAGIEKDAERRADNLLDTLLPLTQTVNQRAQIGRDAAELYKSGIARQHSNLASSLFGFKIILDAFVPAGTIEFRPKLSTNPTP